MIFVFGSNLAGRHGAGAAKYALNKYKAVYGQGVGLQGNSYAIPTKDHYIKTLPLKDIKTYIENFIDFADKNKDMKFKITQIGCGLAGYKPEQIAPLFINCPSNCYFDREWKSILGNICNYWN